MSNPTPKPPEGYESWIEAALQFTALNSEGVKNARAELAALREVIKAGRIALDSPIYKTAEQLVKLDNTIANLDAITGGKL